MEVHLAGYNLDRDLLLEIRGVLEEVARAPAGVSRELDEARRQASEILARDNWTPETLSAAYARISRDPRPVAELRRIARQEVDAARRSNRRIIFGLGHASVAEHAVFNLDILGVSRLAVEEIERMRLCSYTEKSQRYILLESDFVVPEEIAEAGLETEFRGLLERQNGFYRDAYERLRPWVFDRNPSLASEKKNHRMLEGLAKEDARYGLSLATTVQLGETINARNLETLVERTAAHPLAELREFSRRVHDLVAGLAPSIVKHTEPSAYRRAGREVIRSAVAGLFDQEAGASGSSSPPPPLPEEEVVLLEAPVGAEVRVVAALLHSHGDRSSEACRRRAEALGPEGRLALLRRALRDLGPHDPVPREFEHALLHYELVVSAACFGQLKRHRMATLTTQGYDLAPGVTVPPSFQETGLLEPFDVLRRETETVYRRVRAQAGRDAAPYVLLNAHRRRVLFSVNVRELYHIARLRLDRHAQWDIRRVSERMLDLACQQIPGLLLLACGKDRFDEVRRRSLGDAGGG